MPAPSSLSGWACLPAPRILLTGARCVSARCTSCGLETASDHASCPRPDGWCTHGNDAHYTELDCGGVTVPSCFDGVNRGQISGPECTSDWPIATSVAPTCATANLHESSHTTCPGESDTCSAFVNGGTLGMTHIPKACVTGHNIDGSQILGTTVAQCQQHCLDTPGCAGFEYGVNHGGSSDTYPPGSCFPQFGVDTGRTHLPRQCVNGANIADSRIDVSSVAECQEHCLATDGCVAFEYGVDHGGSSDAYPPGSCFPQSSADSAGCDGVLMNLDLYVLDSPVR